MCTKTYVTEIKETYFEIYIYQESCPLALHLILPISNKTTCHYMTNCLYLHDSYIAKLCFS